MGNKHGVAVDVMDGKWRIPKIKYYKNKQRKMATLKGQNPAIHNV
jgi:hypothetical protein